MGSKAMQDVFVEKHVPSPHHAQGCPWTLRPLIDSSFRPSKLSRQVSLSVIASQPSLVQLKQSNLGGFTLQSVQDAAVVGAEVSETGFKRVLPLLLIIM
mmetsp:Transcript_97916/g.204228  ORF Transcript_97916/g.204228 Transcript_97916/m.204228 type:complete len:99 (-) Transcript_97916:1545-1841(-)